MPISRSQMNKQLRAGGGIMDIAPRENFGLGSSFKKFVRKVIPNEVSKVAVKAAPFVAPFNPLLAAGMAGIGGFDQTGSIGKSLRNAALTYGGGQLARYAGGAGFQQGYNPLGGLGEGAYSLGGFQLGASPIGSETGIGKLLSDRAAEAGRNQALSNITPTSGGDYGQFVEAPFGAGDALGGEGLTGTSNILERATEGVVDKAKRSTMDITKDLFSGDFTKMGNAAKELGGKGLKAIYTKPVPGSPGQTQIDKLAIGATIAGATSYMEAAKLAKEAELVDDVDEYTEDMYEADKSRYTDYYSKILTPEAFGLKDGGRIGYKFGSPEMPSKEGITSITLSETDDDNNEEEAMMMADAPGITFTSGEKSFFI